ncbi:bacteriophage antitermination protein Q [Raoultella ornithinolytica]|uniref:bacteriophage antitermination protein Q n=1 Tax=Raoultella ornithinolytica TaxID=54291 RepID=UPI003D35F36E
MKIKEHQNCMVQAWCRNQYQQQELASLTGTTPNNWSTNYASRWRAIREIFLKLDRDSLLNVTKARSQQKSTNYHSCIAKMN